MSKDQKRNRASLEAAIHLVHGSGRDMEEYFRDNLRKPNRHLNHNGGRFDGNVGRLYVSSIPKEICDWVAVSENASYTLETVPPSIGRVTIDEEKSKVTISQLLTGPLSTPVKLRTPENSPDSEYLLLNALNGLLSKTRHLAGVVYLLTDHIPCESCTSVIQNFLKKHPNLSMEIFYFRDSRIRNERSFFGELENGIKPRITVQFLALEQTGRGQPDAVTLHALPVTGNTEHLGISPQCSYSAVTWENGKPVFRTATAAEAVQIRAIQHIQARIKPA